MQWFHWVRHLWLSFIKTVSTTVDFSTCWQWTLMTSCRCQAAHLRPLSEATSSVSLMNVVRSPLSIGLKSETFPVRWFCFSLCQSIILTPDMAQVRCDSFCDSATGTALQWRHLHFITDMSVVWLSIDKKEKKTSAEAVGQWCTWCMPDYHLTLVTTTTAASLEDVHIDRGWTYLHNMMASDDMMSLPSGLRCSGCMTCNRLYWNIHHAWTWWSSCTVHDWHRNSMLSHLFTWC